LGAGCLVVEVVEEDEDCPGRTVATGGRVVLGDVVEGAVVVVDG
jgi:hypothetical protein